MGFIARWWFFSVGTSPLTGPLRGAVQTLVIGALAAGGAYFIAKWIA